MKNVRSTTKILADKLLLQPWTPSQEEIKAHMDKSSDPEYPATPEAVRITMALLSRAKVIEAFQAKGKEDESKVRQEAIDLLTESTKKELQDLGVELPLDEVDLHLDFGDLLMSAYCSKVSFPSAPVAKARVQMKLQTLAVETQKDDFELDAETLAVVDKVLSNDKAWEDLQVETYVKKGDEKLVRICRSQVVSFFPEIVQALIEGFAK